MKVPSEQVSDGIFTGIGNEWGLQPQDGKFP
uniref:Uncharacterized protein n=1 Tax=Neisseria meningitidis alpha275 TaxID=295996 RepID=C6SNJ5_NEIME|nr:hypothetical protein predicted by Glimmer/Critica [Neisseria meningitidis alpha275]